MTYVLKHVLYPDPLSYTVVIFIFHVHLIVFLCFFLVFLIGRRIFPEFLWLM